ncbi:MAG: ribosomal-protein-alanine N-acetyltransferase [Nitrospira sp.]|nr:ribosomal-protein-alanine N-acetyltransferase [Nitrospira sp.]
MERKGRGIAMRVKTLAADRPVIEPATTEDLDQILCIEQRSFSEPWTRKMFEAEFTGNPFAHFAVARSTAAGEARGIMAYIVFWLVFEELRLMNLAVEPTMRRRGLATALVRHALVVGRERGARRAVLEVRASNEAARCLYERMGFAQVALRAKYYTNPIEDALLMESALLEP